MRERYVVIPAGGNGSRMGGEVPKQMMELRGVPVMRRVLDVFLGLPSDVHVVISINPSVRDMWADYCRASGLMMRYVLVNGGVTRFHSVRKALEYVPDGALVAVHDAVRPFIRVSDVEEMFRTAEECPAVIPVVPVPDSVRRIQENGDSSAVDRQGLYLVQTPQVFQSEVLRKAYRTAFSPDFTDDASVVERSGVPLRFYKGNRLNVKITTPQDMEFAGMVIDSGLFRQ